MLGASQAAFEELAHDSIRKHLLEGVPPRGQDGELPLCGQGPGMFQELGLPDARRPVEDQRRADAPGGGIQGAPYAIELEFPFQQPLLPELAASQQMAPA